MKRTVTPVWRRKSVVILLPVIAALAVFGTTTQTWVHVHLAQGAVEQPDLSIAGNKVAVAVSALALVALAGSLAATIAGRIARVITSVIVLLSGLGIVAVVAAVLADPSAAAAGQVGAATGVVGQPSDAATTLFPVLAMIAAVVLCAGAVLLFAAGRGWKQRSKYDAGAGSGARPAEPADDIDSWDRLSRGDDPTD
nr:Trp biosynthesis-associated membrane protein [Specibacter cremeus]